MRQSEAARVVGILAAYFPSRQMPTETVALWATEVVGFDFEDALTAVRAIGTNARFMPALAELVAEIREAQKEREVANRPALPAGQEHFIDIADWRRSVATPEQRTALSGFMGRLAREGE